MKKVTLENGRLAVALSLDEAALAAHAIRELEAEITLDLKKAKERAVVLCLHGPSFIEGLEAEYNTALCGIKAWNDEWRQHFMDLVTHELDVLRKEAVNA